MKIKNAFFSIICAAITISCATIKSVESEKLYNTIWELEYISGQRISFEGLYPEKKPIISFDKETNKVSGNNSCNGYSADYTLTDSSISFEEPGLSTMMYCGEGEKVFLNMIKKVNTYSFDQDGKLNLKINDVPMMRFKKVYSE